MIFDKDMEDLNELIFDLNIGESCVDPSISFEQMEDVISDDNDDSKEIEDISFGHIEPIPKFDYLKNCLMQDGESIKKNEKDVNK